MPKRKNGMSRRQYSDELKSEAVQMLLDGHSAQSVRAQCSMRLLYRLPTTIGPSKSLKPRWSRVHDNSALSKCTTETLLGNLADGPTAVLAT